MRQMILGLGMGAILIWITGCAALPVLPALLGSDPPASFLTTTTVEQSRNNYRIVKTNAIGTSSGFRLLGVITFKSASYTKAITRLYAHAGVTEGEAQALANVLHEETSTSYILFSLPKVTIRADLIEFLDGPATNRLAPSRLESP